MSVVDTVVSSDYELARAQARERELVAAAEKDKGGADHEALTAVYALLEALESKTAYSRAVKILAGLQFTKEMLEAAKVIPICRASKSLESLNMRARSGARLPKTP